MSPHKYWTQKESISIDLPTHGPPGGPWNPRSQMHPSSICPAESVLEYSGQGRQVWSELLYVLTSQAKVAIATPSYYWHSNCHVYVYAINLLMNIPMGKHMEAWRNGYRIADNNLHHFPWKYFVFRFPLVVKKELGANSLQIQSFFLGPNKRHVLCPRL